MFRRDTQQQQQSGVVKKELPYGLSAEAVNFFLAYGEEHLQKYIERHMCQDVNMRQSASLPVYGPSKPPRLQQFVDLETNSAGMTPFFLLGDYVNSYVHSNANEPIGEEYGKEEKTQMQKQLHQQYQQQHQHQQQQQQQLQQQQSQLQGEKASCVLMRLAHSQVAYTPQQHKQPLRMTIDANTTPSSVMGMTLSPATCCRDLPHATPASTAMSSSAVYLDTCARPVPTNNAPVATLFGRHNSSLVNKLEPVFDEMADDRRGQIIITKPSKREEKSEIFTTQTVTAVKQLPCDNTHENHDNNDNTAQQQRQQKNVITKRKERVSQHRGKEKGCEKNKNGNSQQQQKEEEKEQHGGSQLNKASDSHCSSHLSHARCEENITAVSEKKKYFLCLQCHCDRNVTVVSVDTLFNVGDYVIFVADRGVDLGKVLRREEIVDELDVNDVKENNDHVTPTPTPAPVLRFATDEEIAEWEGDLLKQEEEALIECRAACKELGLTIHIAAAAFQFDRQKLTFMYESEKRVDFRVLLQVMFSKYRCRIWMERINATP